jgi:peptidyl-prolyl cis-trans isomerase D
MMKTMRNAAKPIYLIVILAFVGTIIFAWGMEFTSKGKRNPNIAGIINDQEISNEYYYRAYENKYQELIKTSPEPTEDQLAKIRQEAWDNIVNEVLLGQQIRDNKVVVTDEELAQYVGVVAPPEFQKVPDFQTNGQFDMSKYQKYIQDLANSSDPRAEQALMAIEQSVKSQVLTYKLQELVTAGAVVPLSAVQDEYITQNEKVQVKYLFISSANIDTSDIKPTENEIKARYEADKENNYKIDKTATLRYVQINKAPTQLDADSVKNEILKIYNRVIGGEDFAEVAKEVSQDNSAANGGDLGWFGKGRMVKPFEEAAFKLKNIGDISQPVQSTFGWHIIKLTGRKMEKDPKNPTAPPSEQIQASHILLKVIMSEKSLAIHKEQAEKIRQAALSSNLDQAAKELGLTVQETKPFAAGASIPGIGNNPQLNKLAFEGKTGAISDVIETKQALFIATPGVKKPAGYRPLDEVKEQISRVLRNEKITAKAMVKGEALYKEMISQGLDLEQLGAKYNMPVITTDTFARYDFVKNVGSDPAFIGAAFTLSATDRFSKPVKGQTGCYLLEFVSRKPADMTRFAAISDSLYNEKFSRKRNEIWQGWFKAIKENAKIENYTQSSSGA